MGQLRNCLIAYLFLLCATDVCAQKQITTLQADFIQTRTMKMLGEKMVSNGRMCYQQPDRLRWEYTQPYSFTLVMNGSKVMYKRNGSTTTLDASASKAFKDLCQVMKSSMVVTSSKKSLSLPIPKNLRSLYSKVMVYFNQKTSLAERIVMYEKEGDVTEIVLRNVTVNKPLSTALFK